MKKLLLLLSISLIITSCNKNVDCPQYYINIDDNCEKASQYYSGTFLQNSPQMTTTIEAYGETQILFNKTNQCTGQYATLNSEDARFFSFQPQTYVFFGDDFQVVSGSGSYEDGILNYTITIIGNGQTITNNFTGVKQ